MKGAGLQISLPKLTVRLGFTGHGDVHAFLKSHTPIFRFDISSIRGNVSFMEISVKIGDCLCSESIWLRYFRTRKWCWPKWYSAGVRSSVYRREIKSSKSWNFVRHVSRDRCTVYVGPGEQFFVAEVRRYCWRTRKEASGKGLL